jgi:hypothetical protein
LPQSGRCCRVSGTFGLAAWSRVLRHSRAHAELHRSTAGARVRPRRYAIGRLADGVMAWLPQPKTKCDDDIAVQDRNSINDSHSQHGPLRYRMRSRRRALPCPMNRTRFYIVSLTGGHDDVVMGLMFSDRHGSDFVKIVYTCAACRATVGAAASFGLDGSDVVGATCGIPRGAGYRVAALTERSP